MSLSIVLPCYNPPIHWEDVVIKEVDKISSLIDDEIELIIVNDCSTERFNENQIEKIKEALPTTLFFSLNKNQGKGAALRKGVAHASGEKIIITDIDFPYTTQSFIAIYTQLKENFEVVLGHRNNEYYQQTPFFRKLISKILRFSLKSFLKLPTDDSQCGIKGFNQKGKAVFLSTKINRFLFDIEFIKLSSRKKLNFSNVDVQLNKGVVFSKVKLGILLTESFNFIKILFR